MWEKGRIECLMVNLLLVVKEDQRAHLCRRNIPFSSLIWRAAVCNGATLPLDMQGQ